ncbi:MAG TPA: hypothetical protein VEJ18_03595 [Planctomycetota bacterium]|nr:hypothetical protein [Planctomycetota bacterium]
MGRPTRPREWAELPAATRQQLIARLTRDAQRDEDISRQVDHPVERLLFETSAIACRLAARELRAAARGKGGRRP